jgi:hypothetical protein
VPTAPRNKVMSGGAEGDDGEGWNYAGEGDAEGAEAGEGDSDGSSSDEEGDQAGAEGKNGQQRGGAGQTAMEARSFAGNRCDLLWQGLLPKRVFTGFKFQESANAAAARKLLKAKGVGHYWDMVEQADSALAAAAPLSLF